MRRIVLIALAGFLSCLLSHRAVAETWPSKPVQMVVPFSPGGPSDVLARVIAQPLTKAFNQQFIIDNRAGAGGNVGADVVAKASPDGYTLFFSPPGPPANNRFLYKSMPFDPDKDFTPIIAVADMPLVLVINPKLPVSTVAELVDYARRNPGKLSYASPGSGTIGHLAGEMFKQMAGVNILHVPYRGSAPAMQNLLGGFVDLAADNLPPYLQMIQNGQLKALAVTTMKRWPSLPAVPTMNEAGFTGLQASSWMALLGPAKLPFDIVAAINRVVNDFLSSPDGKKRLNDLGYAPVGGTPADLAKLIQADVSRWGPVVQHIGITLD